jgi:hypothetical protein
MNTSRTTTGLGAVLIVVSLAGAGGCAFGTRHAELSYPPNPGNTLIDSARAESGAGPACCDVVLTVSDRRATTARIGNVRNTFGMDTADVVTQDDVRSWVEGALTQELRNAGYAVIADQGSAASGEAIRLNAEIIKVHCDVYMTYDGEVSMAVTLSAKDQAPLARNYEGSGGVGLNWAATADSYAQSLALALQNAISQVLVDLAQYQKP